MANTWGGSRPGSGRKHSKIKRIPRAFRLSDAEYVKAKEIINVMKEGESMTQSQHYELAGDGLKGAAATRAYRAAQNHLLPTDPNYMEDLKRLQDKIIKSLDEGREIKMRNTVEDFLNTETYISNTRGHTIHISRAPEFATQAVVEDADGKRTMVDVGGSNWDDFEDFLDAVIDEYEK